MDPPATEQESMRQGPNNVESQMGENSIDEVPKRSGAPTSIGYGIQNPNTATSPRIEGMVNTAVVHKDIEGVARLGKQQEQLHQPNQVRNDVAVNNPPEGPNPSQAQGHASDSESSLMKDHGRGASARASDILLAVSNPSDFTKTMILNLANCAMEDLVTMSKKEFNPFDIQPSDRRLLTARESTQRFPGSEYLELEATRETAYVCMNRHGIVEMLMDLNRWAAKFSDLVSRAVELAVIHPGAKGSYDGALQVMKAEFHIPTPLVPARESYFARYCKKLSSDTWGVVDISLDSLYPFPASARYRRRPSGCLIQELANDFSKVTWIELVEVDNRLVDGIFQPAVCSGFAFGAQRWVLAIVRESYLLQVLKNGTRSLCGIPMTMHGIGMILHVLEDMLRGFFTDLSASSTNLWTPLQSDEDLKIMAKRAPHYPGSPGGGTIMLSTSVAIPVPPKRVFDFLSDDESRPKWDILSKDRVTLEITKIPLSADPESQITLYETKDPLDSTGKTMFHLQKSYTDSTFSYVVYSPIDPPFMWLIISGGDPEQVDFLTSGFTIFPDRPILPGEESSGSILTVMFHVVDSTLGEDPSVLSSNSLSRMQSLMSRTIKLIEEHTARDRQHDSARQGSQR